MKTIYWNEKYGKLTSSEVINILCHHYLLLHLNTVGYGKPLTILL